MWDITSLVNMHLVEFFDVAARRRSGDEPITGVRGWAYQPCQLTTAYGHG